MGQGSAVRDIISILTEVLTLISPPGSLCLDAPFGQKFRRLGTTGRCLENVTIKIFMGEEEMPGGEVRNLGNIFSFFS